MDTHTHRELEFTWEVLSPIFMKGKPPATSQYIINKERGIIDVRLVFNFKGVH